MQFTDTLFITLQDVISPSRTQHKTGVVVIKGKEVDGFGSSFQYAPFAAFLMFLRCFLKPLRWQNDVCHDERISLKSSFEVEYPFIFPFWYRRLRSADSFSMVFIYFSGY